MSKDNLSEILFIINTSTHQTLSFRTGSKSPLSINPEQIPALRPGKVVGLIFGEQKGINYQFPSLP